MGLCRAIDANTTAAREAHSEELAFKKAKHAKDHDIASARIALDAKIAENEAKRQLIEAENEAKRLRIEELKIQLELEKLKQSRAE